jgi:serine/threonine-protein kinase HipA
LSIPSSGWDGRIGLPTRKPSAGVTDVVLKFEQTTRYPGIIELEALALDLHREAGFNVPRYWQCFFKDMPALAIERFDRDDSNRPVFTESLFSILASGAPLTSHYDYRYDFIARAIDTSAVSIVSHHAQAKTHLFKRLLLALLTGNGDLHLENLSIIDINGARNFTQVYDPAPMRAYSQHDMLSVMPFGDYGEMPEGYDKPVKLHEAIVRFAKVCGLNKTQCDETVHSLLAVTKNYATHVGQLETVPAPNKERLIRRVEEVRKQLV